MAAPIDRSDEERVQQFFASDVSEVESKFEGSDILDWDPIEGKIILISPINNCEPDANTEHEAAPHAAGCRVDRRQD